MDHQATQQQVVAMAGQQSQAPYGTMPQNSPLQTGLPSAANPSPQAMAAGAQPPPVAYQSAISYPHPHPHLQQQHQQQQMQAFWMGQMQEIERVTDFKNHQLPLARIKKIMKADEDVRMISAEAPVVFAKACEMFILELTLRSWIHTEENKRRTLQKNDIAAAITGTDIFDFLVDIVPRDEVKEDGLGITPAHPSSYGGLYYVPQPQPQGAPALPQPMPMMVGRPALMADPSMYTQQTRPPSIPYTPQQMWQQPMGNPIPGLPPSSC